MRAHYLQHAPFEGLGSIEAWLKSVGFTITCTRLFEKAALPHLEAIDMLIVMGGPMSVNDEIEFPWLVREKRFIRSVVEVGKPVLGVCLGAQLIASAMGARVFPNSVKEIGWFPIQGVPSSDMSTFRFPSSVEVFHWHGETFDLPAGASLLAKSKACRNQAFQLGRSVMGLQFHLETTPESAKEMVSNCRAELIPSEYVQAETAILSVSSKKYRAINGLMVDVLAFLMGNKGFQSASSDGSDLVF